MDQQQQSSITDFSKLTSGKPIRLSHESFERLLSETNNPAPANHHLKLLMQGKSTESTSRSDFCST